MPSNKDFKYSLQFKGLDKLSPMLSGMQKTVGKTAKELRTLRKAETQFGKFKTLRQNAPRVSADLKKASQEAAKLGRELGQTEKPTSKMTKAFQKAQKQVQSLKAQQAKEIAELAKLGGSLRKAGYNANNYGQTQDRLRSNVHRTRKELEKQRRELKRVSNAYKRQAAAKAKYQQDLQTSANLGIVGASGVAVGTRSLKGTFSLVETIRPLEAAIGELQSLGVENLDVYRAQAAKTDAQLAYTTADSFIRAAYDVRSGMSGLSDEGVAGITDYALVTARATKSSAEQMTSLTASAYGIFKSQYKDMSDLKWGETFTSGLAASVKAFKTNGSEMQQSIEGVGKTAAQLGMGMTEQFAVLGTLQTSMSAGESGTALASYARSAAKAHKYFEDNNIDVQILDGQGQLRDTIAVMADIRAAYGQKIDGFEAAEIQKAFGRAEAVKVISGLIDNQETYNTGFKEIAAGMKEGRKFTDAMAARMDNNADAKIQNAVEEWAAMKRELGYALLPIFTDLIPVLKKVTSGVSKFTQDHKTLVKFIGTGIVAFGALATVMGAITITMASMLGPLAVLRYAKTMLGIKALGLTSILKGMGTALMWLRATAIPAVLTGLKTLTVFMLTNPIGLAIAALAVGALLIVKYWKPIKAFFKGLWSEIGFPVTGLGASIKTFAKGVAKAVKFMLPISGIKLLWGALKMIGAALKWVVRLFKPVETGAQGAENAGQAFGKMLKTAFRLSPFSLFARTVKAAFKLVSFTLGVSTKIIKSTWSLFKLFFAWSPVGLLLRGVGAGLKLLKSLIGQPRTAAAKTWRALKTIMAWSPLGLFKKMWNAVPHLFTNIFDKATAAVRAAMSAVTALIAKPLSMLAALKDTLTFKGLRDKLGAPQRSPKTQRTAKALSASAPVKTAKALKTVNSQKIFQTIKLGAVVGASSLAMPALAGLAPGPNISQSPLYAPAAPAVHEGDTIIHVHPAPGMDEAALARLVRAELDRRDREKKRKASNSLSDHGDR